MCFSATLVGAIPYIFICQKSKKSKAKANSRMVVKSVVGLSALIYFISNVENQLRFGVHTCGRGLFEHFKKSGEA